MAATAAATQHANNAVNGHAPPPSTSSTSTSSSSSTTTSSGKKAVVSEAARARDKLADTHTRFEFGGPIGVSAMMIGFPCMMYYFWICLWFNQGRLVLPSSWDLAGGRALLVELGTHIQRDAYPTAWAFKVYLGLMAYELGLALVLPGKTQKGLPVPSLGYKQLTYHCNALACWYVTLATSASLHLTGLFDLADVIDQFGPLMSVAILVGFAVSALVFAGSKLFHWGGRPLRLSGSLPYDFFMGSSLNPRIGSVDLKMWQEVRIPWVLLFHIAVSAAIKQVRVYGSLSPNMAFMVLATGLYINACAKGEECIPVSIDMIYEKDGFMLTFWNFAGVPFTYAYSIIYLHRTNPAVYAFSWPTTVGLYALLLTSYWIFDTANSQKAIFRLEDAGGYVPRKAFPQLPWRRVTNPTFIETAHGSKLLTSGWYRFCVKPHYLADFVQSFSWGLCTGFSTPIAYFYPMWFITVLIHRCGRDFEKCEEKYGEDWKRYLKVVKYKFIPGVY